MKAFDSLRNIIRELRSEQGCPWDREQTLESLKTHLIEEAYEVYEAIEEGLADKLREELGDQLLHVMLLSQISEESGDFTINEVIETISEKLVRRHPHVFGGERVEDSGKVARTWDEIKKEERGPEASTMDGLPKALPALLYALRMTERAERVGFDWERPDDVADKVQSEIDELRAALADEDDAGIREEFGDLLFTLANLGRHLGINPEEALQESNRKFESRFRKMEARLKESGVEANNAGMEEMDRIWKAIKRE